jgi:hypothetical protein
LNSETIWKIWKKGKLNSEMIWKIWKISVSHNYTQRDLLLLLPALLLLLLILLLPALLLLLPLHVYTLFFRIEKNHHGIVFC